MGSLRPGATIVARTGGSSPAPRQTGQSGRIDTPWIRGVMLSPSIHHAMGVAVMGLPDYRGLVNFMQKPSSSLQMAFSADLDGGLASEVFAGKAVTFLPVVTFGTITAGLN
jgi:hypothetical protein